MTNGSGGGIVGVILPLAFLGITLGVVGGIAQSTRRQLGGGRISNRRGRVVSKVRPPRAFSQPRLLQTRSSRFRRVGII